MKIARLGRAAAATKKKKTFTFVFHELEQVEIMGKHAAVTISQSHECEASSAKKTENRK